MLHDKLRSHVRITPLLVGLFILAGCASDKPKPSDRRPAPVETFSTEITKDGTKLFSYSLEMPKPNTTSRGAKSGRKARRSPDASGKRSPNRDKTGELARRLDERLKRKIEETGFCQEGYLVLDRYVGRGNASIRGECREGAYDEEAKDKIATS